SCSRSLHDHYCHPEPFAMRHSFLCSQHLGRERGAVLIVALVLLLVMTILGVSSLSSTTLQERMAGNLRDSNLAFQAAEAALREGEEFLRQAVLPPFTGAAGLLERQDGGGRAEFWNSYDWAGNGRTAAQPDGTA